MGLRQVITKLLMLLMLTPAMVCVMSFCPMPQAKAASPPCHEMMGHESAPAKTPAKAPMLAKDCLKNDLDQATAASAPAPQEHFFVFCFILPLLFMTTHPVKGRMRQGTGPPPRTRASFHRILITQRILQ